MDGNRSLAVAAPIEAASVRERGNSYFVNRP
jgi:hypothetical protein